MDLVHRADNAAASKNYTEAEDLYRQGMARWHDGIAAEALANIQDRLGQYREEVDSLREVVGATDNSESQNPSILVRFADLSMQYGSKDEARAAYLKVAKRPIEEAETYAIPVPALSIDSPLPILRTYAYLVVAHGGGNDPADPSGMIRARRFAELAVSLRPNDQLPRVVYASALSPRLAQDRDQWLLAEQMGSSTTRDLIEKFHGAEFVRRSTATVSHGKIVSTHIRYTLKQPIYTPHPIDPIAANQGP